MMRETAGSFSSGHQVFSAVLKKGCWEQARRRREEDLDASRTAPVLTLAPNEPQGHHF